MSASIPKETPAWIITKTEGGFDSIKLESKKVPELGEFDVLVDMKAATLNYRDLIIPKGQYPFPVNTPVVAASDGAGVVRAVGPKVTLYKPGSRVTTLFNQAHQSGPMTPAAMVTGLGGAVDGVLRHHAIFPESGLVPTPSVLSDVEAASLPCAALTAWNCLYGLKPIKPGDAVLVQGTGGVSIFALQFAKAAGCWVVATTSSEEKAARLRELGADLVINYRTTSNWGEVAKEKSPGGFGVDHVVEIGGDATIGQSYAAVKLEGIISVVGFVGGADEAKKGHLETLSNLCTLRGVYVGSRAMMLDMNRAIEANNIHPVIDKTVFEFEKTREAYEYQNAMKHFGKVAIKIGN
ncbi:hypothetical protein EDC01DRAFT_774696 [Geopyxis carbonaria]|nr:hypothetical protein EDC01DRAFT_774696 [Geopyxis carbonaria]